MPISAIHRSSTGYDQGLTGVSAALAEARLLFRKAVPDMSWTEVTAAANELRRAQPMTLLEALHVVFGRLAEGR